MTNPFFLYPVTQHSDTSVLQYAKSIQGDIRTNQFFYIWIRHTGDWGLQAQEISPGSNRIQSSPRGMTLAVNPYRPDIRQVSAQLYR